MGEGNREILLDIYRFKKYVNYIVLKSCLKIKINLLV